MKISRQRLSRSGGALLALITFWLAAAQLDAANSPKPHENGDLFTSTAIPHLRIDISPEEMEILRHYEFDINDLMEQPMCRQRCWREPPSTQTWRFISRTIWGAFDRSI